MRSSIASPNPELIAGSKESSTPNTPLWHEYITADPAVLVGKPVIRGTRLVVEFILGLLAQGWPEQEIIRNYGLTAEQVRACAAYAQERLNEEKVFAVTG